MTYKPQTKIQRQELQVFPSERLTDNDDGGGLPVNTPLTGADNELFNPITAIASTNGGFYARQVYAGVMRADNEPLLGSYMAITKPPINPYVSYLMCKSGKFGEQRIDALKRIEAFSVATIESRLTLLSNQSANSRIVQAYQRTDETIPNVGDVFCLRQDMDGYSYHEQYIQITSIESEVRTFVDQETGKEFQKTVCKIEISGKLEADFVGISYPTIGYFDTPCKLLETHIADASQYYGVKKLKTAIKQGLSSITIDGLMEKLVPTSQIEKRMLDEKIGGGRIALFNSSKTDDFITMRVSKKMQANDSIFLTNPPMPNTITLTVGDKLLKDKGGYIVDGDHNVAKIDYQNRSIKFNDNFATATVNTVTYQVSTVQVATADTFKKDITINNRGYNFIHTINSNISQGSLVVKYRSNGRWYDLFDDGTGTLRGATPSHGSGSISYITGTVNISLGELPDVGSSILYSWANNVMYNNRADQSATAEIVLQLEERTVAETIVLKWKYNNADKTAVCDEQGMITGDFVGRYDFDRRQIRIATHKNFSHPSSPLTIDVEYNKGFAINGEMSYPTAVNNIVTLEINGEKVRKNTLRLSVIYREKDGDNYKDIEWLKLTDDGNGKLFCKDHEVGIFDYTTNTATFNDTITVDKTVPIFETVDQSKVFSRYETQTVTLYYSDSANAFGNSGFFIDYRYYSNDSSDLVSEQLTTKNIEIELLSDFDESLASGSINFTHGGQTYFDRGGKIYRDLDVATGSATVCGVVDYSTSIIQLDNWLCRTASPLIINSLATINKVYPVNKVSFCTPTAPIRSGEFTIQGVTLDGTLVNGVADITGTITGKGTHGSIDYEYGVVSVVFDSFVIADSINFSAVGFSNLPIDNSIVKIDTVRLPQDGRVPIFRRGDTILITNSVTDDLGSAFTANQTLQLSRGDVDRICLTDSNNKHINAQLWDYDLENGTITFAPSLDFGGYKMPLKAHHTQEERNRIMQIDISGRLELAFATSRDYPLDNTYVSSLLIIGDLQVRHSVPFTQRSWDRVWRDEPKGDQLLNKLNLTDYPAILTNDGTITDRWLFKFKNANQFEFYGETVGYVGTFDTLQDFAPINPATGKPFITIPKEAFGGEGTTWAKQDVIRLNTWGTLAPVQILCAVQPNQFDQPNSDGFKYCLYGDTVEI